MIIKFNSLATGENLMEFPLKLKEVGLHAPFTGEGYVKLRFEKSHHQLVMHCKLSVAIDALCDRCGKEIVQKLDNNFDFVYLFQNKEEEDDDSFNIRFLHPDADKVDITQEIYDYANLSIPLKILCEENCKGLCPQCGINLNESNCDCSNEPKGPLWNSMQELKKKLENNNK